MLRSRICGELDEISDRSWRQRRSSPHNAKDYRAAGETGNALFACQLGVCAGRGSEPETAHVCNAFTFISRSTLGVAIGCLEGNLCQRCACIVNKETTMPDSFML